MTRLEADCACGKRLMVTITSMESRAHYCECGKAVVMGWIPLSGPTVVVPVEGEVASHPEDAEILDPRPPTQRTA